MLLKQIKFIQNIGCFEKCLSLADSTFGPCTLVFGENGWGKSTFADILRSRTTNNPDIVIGRKTLASGPEQKAVILFGDQQTVYENGAWTGTKPRIEIYDSVFVNDNVYSGDIVSHEHLKNQYGLVVGEDGVRHVRRIGELDTENRENNTNIRNAEAELHRIIGSLGPNGMSIKQFQALKAISGVDTLIKEKEDEIRRASRAKELKGANEPRLLPVLIEIEELRKCLHRSIEDIAVAAANAVQDHITKRARKRSGSTMTYESWLEAGTIFVEGDDCAFCGQSLDNRTLIDSYAEFFGDAYKTLAADVKAKRDIFAYHEGSDYRDRIKEILETNEGLYTYWEEAGQIERPKLEGVETVIIRVEEAARLLDAVFVEKQENLTVPASGVNVVTAISAWNEVSKQIKGLNSIVGNHVQKIKALKDSINETLLPRLEKELYTLKASKRRFENNVSSAIKRLENLNENRERIAREKEDEKRKLANHARVVTETLGNTINSYLTRLNVGFKIDYKAPNYHGKEPAASYQILINDVPVLPRTTSENLAQASFRNTLSAGDKSTLALALFLAKLNADPALEETIVVLDDPFTSLDNFRRQFTANEIRKLCQHAAQTIVLSHDKNFLRLLWDKISNSMIKCVAIQTGAPDVTTIAPYDIELETQPRYVTERMKIEDFIEGGMQNEGYIRTRLRTVCENFYRRGDPGLFHNDANLGEIIRILERAPIDHPYRSVVEDLRDINEYTRGEHHAEIEGNPSGESSNEELKGFCRKVLKLTRGM